MRLGGSQTQFTRRIICDVVILKLLLFYIGLAIYIHSRHKKGMPKGLCLGFDIYDKILNPDCSEVINNK